MIHADTLERFILAPKPEWCTGLDVSITAHLIVLADAGGHSSPLQADLAKATGASTINFKGLRKSIDRLHVASWITMIKGSMKGERHRYQVHFENLPGKEKHEQDKQIGSPSEG